MFDKRKYDKEYVKKNITQKKVCFNRKNAKDITILKYINNHIDNFSEFVKTQIEDKMNNTT